MALLSLPIELIIEILSYCDGEDILNFEEATNFDATVDVWKKVSLSHPPADFKRCRMYLGCHTDSIKIGGSTKESIASTIIGELYFSRLTMQCQNLTHLAIENTNLDYRIFTHHLLPRTLEFLKLSNIIMIIRPDQQTIGRNISLSLDHRCTSLKKIVFCEPTSSFPTFSDSLKLFTRFFPYETNLHISTEDKTLHYTFNTDLLRSPTRFKKETKLKFDSVFKDLIEFHNINPWEVIELYSASAYTFFTQPSTVSQSLFESWFPPPP